VCAGLPVHTPATYDAIKIDLGQRNLKLNAVGTGRHSMPPARNDIQNGADRRWRSLPQAEAPTEPAGETWGCLQRRSGGHARPYKLSPNIERNAQNQN
ncbi:MAG: hypothetical protein IK118_03285, partial [Clostridia bacterium]|nr:hypothetical protein [Clostridia bacterium]